VETQFTWREGLFSGSWCSIDHWHLPQAWCIWKNGVDQWVHTRFFPTNHSKFFFLNLLISKLKLPFNNNGTNGVNYSINLCTKSFDVSHNQTFQFPHLKSIEIARWVYLDYDQVLNQEIDFEKHNIHKESFTHQSI